ncbi:MAG TPA: ATP--guanido phosphotransferase [Spirochaetota bacterium]|nr:ATP--guanido phosphotransferase [Spirochaetota bacterium]HQP49920.1 ATP--guanido phosphotransferase [Spirochaetota bacterium]
MFEELQQKKGFWSHKGPSGDIVLSTRVRLARNIPSLNFPHRQSRTEFSLIRSIIERFAAESIFRDNVRILEVHALADDDRRFLRERNLITSELETAQYGIAVVDSEEEFVIMVNEEDHFRIQVIEPGFQLMKAYQLADRVDNELNRFVAYAYSNEFGYLTACPSNIGTALKASVMLHLPLISLANIVLDAVKLLREKKIDIKGVVGEGTDTVGNIFIIANQTSLGVSEVDIIERVDEAARILIDMEDERRDAILGNSGLAVENLVWRSYGVLKYSRSVSYIESINHLSHMRLGIVLSCIKNIDLYKINDLMVNMQWSHLQRIAGKVFISVEECDVFRAEYLKQVLEQ